MVVKGYGEVLYADKLISDVIGFYEATQISTSYIRGGIGDEINIAHKEPYSVKGTLNNMDQYGKGSSDLNYLNTSALEYNTKYYFKMYGDYNGAKAYIIKNSWCPTISVYVEDVCVFQIVTTDFNSSQSSQNIYTIDTIDFGTEYQVVDPALYHLFDNSNNLITGIKR